MDSYSFEHGLEHRVLGIRILGPPLSLRRNHHRRRKQQVRALDSKHSGGGQLQDLHAMGRKLQSTRRSSCARSAQQRHRYQQDGESANQWRDVGGDWHLLARSWHRQLRAIAVHRRRLHHCRCREIRKVVSQRCASRSAGIIGRSASSKPTVSSSSSVTHCSGCPSTDLGSPA